PRCLVRATTWPPPFKVHAPHSVGASPLLQRPTSARHRFPPPPPRFHQPMPLEHRAHRASDRTALSPHFLHQLLPQLRCSPIRPPRLQREDALFEFLAQRSPLPVRRPRPLFQRSPASLFISLHPLVDDRPAHLKAPAQFAYTVV